MYQHEKDDQINVLIEAGLISKENKEKARKALDKYWDDKIGIVWMAEDVLHRAKEIEKEITLEQAKEVLRICLSEHDANLGVCWETFDYWIDYVLDNEEKDA